MRINTTRVAVFAASALAASAVLGFTITAADDELGDQPPVPAGELYVDGVDDGFELDETTSERITTEGTTYDPTPLTTFISGAEFDVRNGSGANADLIVNSNGSNSCIYADPSSGGEYTQVYAGLALPDGALITRILAFGKDSDPAHDMSIYLTRTTFRYTLGATIPVRTDSTAASFNTGAATDRFLIQSAANLDIVTGSDNPAALQADHRFFSLLVQMWNDAGSSHTLCGIEVVYQVPTAAAGDGTTFFPIDPVRAYDGRIASYPNSGILAPNASKVISVKDGHDAAGSVNLANAVPVGATAVTYNVTIAGPTGPNFVAVTPGDASGFTTSAINFNGTADVANAGTVTLDSSRQVKVWGGDQAGSTYAIIDITGYFLPTTHPNMAN